MRGFWLFLISVLLAGCTAVASDQGPWLVLTARENGLESDAEFHCQGKIHGYLRLTAPVVGAHLLESTWRLPNGEVVARSRDTLDFPPPGRSTAYVWFSFPDPPTLGKIDPKLDQERLKYPGTWTVDISLDEKPLIKSTLSVKCP